MCSRLNTINIVIVKLIYVIYANNYNVFSKKNREDNFLIKSHRISNGNRNFVLQIFRKLCTIEHQNRCSGPSMLKPEAGAYFDSSVRQNLSATIIMVKLSVHGLR